MAKLRELASELLVDIAQYLTTEELANLSLTCRYLHRVLSPALYEGMSWSNQDDLALSVALAARRHPKLVKRMAYHAVYTDHLAPEWGTKERSERENGAPGLGLLYKLPGLGLRHLQQLDIVFVFGFLENTHQHSFILEGDSLGETTMWMAHLLPIWNALLLMRGIKHLRLVNFPPTSFPCPVDSRPFFGNLEHLELSLFGSLFLPEFDGEWLQGTNTRLDYAEAISQLNTSMFGRMENLKKLRLEASEYSPIGAHFHLPFPIGVESLPNLKELRLKHFIVSQELVDFMATRHGTLETLALDHCHARPPLSSRDGQDIVLFEGQRQTIVWADFFGQIAKDGAALSSISVTPEIVPISTLDDNQGLITTTNGTFVAGVDWAYTFADSSADQLTAFRETRRLDPDRRFFSYVNCEPEEITFWFSDRDGNCHHFIRGEDWSAFKALLSRMKRNQEFLQRAKVYGMEACQWMLPATSPDEAQS